MRSVLATVAVAIAATIAAALPASAHEPVELDSSDVVPWKGPLILDGQSPTMLFGTLPRAGAVRSAQLRLTAGQQLVVNLAVPDQAPENQLTPKKLPTVTIVAPDFTVTQVKATIRVPIMIGEENPLAALLLASYSAPAVPGTYSIIVSGRAPSRFAVATGVEGLPFGGIERGHVATDEDVLAWYNTPPSTAAARTDLLARRHAPV
ncbi:hypothetical protein ACIBO9_06070 [Streptomyces prunicolor]|uniref:hypothetical protein n=1 Tax=Streptomyces prunicolor TaxID=67348 RepID=UPI0037D5D655